MAQQVCKSILEQSSLPQLAENNATQLMDATGVHLSYDKYGVAITYAFGFVVSFSIVIGNFPAAVPWR